MTTADAIRCDICGRFVAYADLEAGTARITEVTPDSEYTREEWLTECSRCHLPMTTADDKAQVAFCTYCGEAVTAPHSCPQTAKRHPLADDNHAIVGRHRAQDPRVNAPHKAGLRVKKSRTNV